jgi:hypothetical protein
MSNEYSQAAAEACMRLQRALSLSEALLILDGNDKDDVERLLREALELLRGIDSPVM